jgi:hypothetical protein
MLIRLNALNAIGFVWYLWYETLNALVYISLCDINPMDFDLLPLFDEWKNMQE